MDINNPAESTPEANLEVTESPDTGQEEVTEDVPQEQAEPGTDNAEVTPEKFKSLQAEFTRKSQEYADFKKRYDKESEELNAYRKMYSEQQSQSPESKTAKEFAEMSEMEKFNYLVHEQVRPLVEPLQQENSQLKQLVNALMTAEDKRLWNGFVEKNPEAKDYRDKIYEMVAKHQIDPDEAWALLNKDKLKDSAKQEVLKEFQAKKDASKIMKPVSTPSTPIDKKVDSFEDAFEQAKKELSRSK